MARHFKFNRREALLQECFFSEKKKEDEFGLLLLCGENTELRKNRNGAPCVFQNPQIPVYSHVL